MAEQTLTINIPTSSQKLRQNFPDDPKSDIIIQLKQTTYRLNKAYLRLQSKYFKKILTVDRSILQITQDFDQESFRNILECFYGATLQIKRKDVLKYFPIVQFLQIDGLITIFREDMVSHTSQYGLFKLFNMAYRYADQKLFEKCLLELQFHNFTQIRTEKADVMKISVQLFKLIIKTHNKLPRQKRTYNVYQIKNLITQYTNYNNMSSAQKNNLKFQLIDKTNLNSFQYRDIFLNDTHAHHSILDATHNNKKFQTRALSLNTMRNQKNIDMFINAQSMTLLTHKKLYLEMDTTFQRKISNQLIQQNSDLCAQLQNLSIFTINQHKNSKSIKLQFDALRKKITEKSQQNFYSQKIKSIDNSLSQLSKSLSSQSQRLSILMKNTQELIQKYDENQNKLDMSQDSCSSSLLNLNQKNQKINQFVLIRNQARTNQKQKQKMKSNTNRSNTSVVSKSQFQIKDRDRERDTDKYNKDRNQANVSITSFTGQPTNRRQKMQNLAVDDNKSVKQRSKQKSQPHISYNYNDRDNSNNNNNNNNTNNNTNKDKDKEKEKNQKQQTQKQNKNILNYKQSRIQFNQQQTIIKTQKQLQSFASILSIQKFTKKKLKFVYRAQKPNKKLPISNNKNNNKSNSQISKQIKQMLQNRQNVIIIIRVDRDKLIGGYYSAPLSFTMTSQFFDQKAYIFSITQGKKYMVKKQSAPQALMTDPGYLICFGFDLMISQIFFEIQNYCAWPDRYEKDKNIKERGSEWLAGETQFAVKQMEIWEIEDTGSQMVI